jgi:hypothetical protein
VTCFRSDCHGLTSAEVDGIGVMFGA